MIPKQNGEKQSEQTTTVIINDIENEFCKPECNDIGTNVWRTKRLTINEFISRANKKHKNYYDYSKTKYVNCESDIVILCPIHGEFSQQPRHHLQGSGCKQCHYEFLHLTFKQSKEDFVRKAIKTHNNYYDYSLVDYKNWRIDIKIICPKHGIFNQIPNHHLRGSGCPKCYHFISKAETAFLNFVNVQERGVKLKQWKKKIIDGYDPITNTVYEFLGDYWHGNPAIKKFHPLKIHPVTKLTYGQMYKRTFNTLQKIKSFGYVVKYIWENDWYDFIKGKTELLNIQTL